MVKINKEFFAKGEIIYWDVLKKGVICPISKKVTQVLVKNGVEVFEIKKSEDAVGPGSLPKVPEHAYVLYHREDEQFVINQLIQCKVKHVLFHPFHAPSKEALNICKENGIETVIGCPNMVFGYGCCKAHAMLTAGAALLNC
jgi:hypothetical protein